MSEEKDIEMSLGGKRLAEEDDDAECGQSSKRQRLEGIHTELRLLLPSKNAGAIIGKGGENIKRLRQTFKASISVPDSRGPERLMIIGGNVDQICAVLTDVIRKMEKTENKEDIECEIRLLIHQTQAGRIIGKGGSKIKELRQESGAQVKVYAECCPQSMDRVAQLNGSLSNVVTCLETIFELLDKSPVRGANVQYNPNNYDEFNAAEYGGYSEGRSSRGRGNHGDGGRGDSFKGAGRNQDQGFGGLNGLAGFSGIPGIGLGQFGLGSLGNMMGGIGGLGALMNAGSQKQTTTQVSIPKNLAGAIIGKGGCRIREIQQESGTTIKIDNESNESNERIITITGSQNQIQYAQYLLQMTVKRHAKTY